MVDWISGLVGTAPPLFSQDLVSHGLVSHGFLSTTTPSVPWLAEIAEAEVEPLVLASVLLSLIVVYLAAKIGGELCARVNLPPVLGELLGGVVVGVSALHLIVFPEAGTNPDSILMNFVSWVTGIAPEDGLSRVFAGESEALSVLAELGVIILLFEIGLESDLKELIRVGPQAAVVAVIGVVVPFAAGTAGLIGLFGVDTIPAVFAGAALTATSIGITAKVLAELQKLSSTEGQIIIGAAVLDDVLGIIVLAVVASLAKTGEIEILNVVYLVIGAAVFLVGSIFLGRLLSPYFVALVEKLRTRGQVLISSLIFAFVLAYIASAIHLEAILGAFAAGLILAETSKHKELEEQISPIADMLVPIFFITVGARTDISVLNPLDPNNRPGLIIASFLVVVAFVGKVVTGFAVFGQPGINRLAVGIGMVPRGEVGLVFAGVGAASGVLTESLDAAIIVMVILTTFLAPPLLRLVFVDKDVDEPPLKESDSLATVTQAPNQD
ncbi:cation:proton antiporter [Phormidium sp. FACHB-1136]|uniref:cation:proton antiporter n=1 Tax=Phormidium sp. FACHB-1136 TaxID=2692848 RepID=UPI001685186F|nr:cation:proton antiporter [Phormidium sp. FACHB-1136]MBD2425345.1 cation:proton antiporter [Phormidium sp. FACHB-1136]